MLNRIKELLKQGKDFAFETTLSTKSYVPFIRHARKLGYTIVLIYFWLESVDLAKNRVAERVKRGGHSIPEATIERRYCRGLINFFKLYRSLTDSWIVYDNSKIVPAPLAKGNGELVGQVYNYDIWQLVEEKNE